MVMIALLKDNEGIYNEASDYSPYIRIKIKRIWGVNIDSTCHRHGGKQKMVIDERNNFMIIPLPV
jgi:hypothetical protein